LPKETSPDSFEVRLVDPMRVETVRIAEPIILFRWILKRP
jgi:hypothetical protein